MALRPSRNRSQNARASSAPGMRQATPTTAIGAEASEVVVIAVSMEGVSLSLLSPPRRCVVPQTPQNPFNRLPGRFAVVYKRTRLVQGNPRHFQTAEAAQAAQATNRTRLAHAPPARAFARKVPPPLRKPGAKQTVGASGLLEFSTCAALRADETIYGYVDESQPWAKLCVFPGIGVVTCLPSEPLQADSVRASLGPENQA